MKLFLTDDTYVVSGVTRPGVPFLCDREMELVEAPNRYLDHIAVVRGRTRAPNTWATYADQLYDYFSFLEANRLDWMTADERTISAWRDGMVQRGNRVGTINQRLRGVQRFYDWAALNRLVPFVPFTSSSVVINKSAPFLAHVDVSGSRSTVSEVTLREPRRLPRFLHIDQATKFLDAIRPRRMRLMGYTMLLTGMRREEVAGLDYRVLPNPAGQPVDRALDMLLDSKITPTKGSKDRLVKVPYMLGEALYEYFTWERPALERKHFDRYGTLTTKLFLTEQGDELSVESVSVVFNVASKKLTIKCTPHMLRHTFGTYEFLRMSAKYSKDRAIYWVRDRLGHSSIVTTEIYVHLADSLTFDATDGYVEDVCRALAHGN